MSGAGEDGRMEHPHICQPLARAAQSGVDARVIMTCGHRMLTASQLAERVAVLSAGLARRMGRDAAGARVALLGQNSADYFVALLACADAGLIACPLNTRWTAGELGSAMALVQPALALADEAHMPALAAALATQPALRGACATGLLPSLQQLEAGEQSLAAWRPHGGGASAPPPGGPGGRPAVPGLALRSAPGGTALLCFTSGTTGAPKAAMLSHAALQHQSLAKLAVVGYAAADTYLHLTPLFHVGGISSALALLEAGGAHVFLPRYSPAAALGLIQRHRVTALIAVPAMVEDLAAAAAAAGQLQAGVQPGGACPSVRVLLVGAGGMQPPVQAAAAALFPCAAIWTAYGMTEAASSITFHQLRVPGVDGKGSSSTGSNTDGGPAPTGNECGPDVLQGRPPLPGACVGRPGPGIEVRLDPDPLRYAGAGAAAAGSSACSTSGAGDGGDGPGEVLTCGPHLMAGYWGEEGAAGSGAGRAAWAAPGGWLRTGDLGWRDRGGRLWLVGRLKDTVKTGGENVVAAEVEAALCGHPGVAAAAVVGLPHPRLGEAVAAALVLAPGWAWQAGQQPGAAAAAARRVGEAELRQACRAAGLAGFKVPQQWGVWRALPRTSTGKVHKARLRQAMAEQQRAEQQQQPPERERMMATSKL